MSRAALIQARKDALASGSLTYQGKPCAHGHNGTRYAANRLCVDCAKANRARQTAQEQAARAAIQAKEA